MTPENCRGGLQESLRCLQHGARVPYFYLISQFQISEVGGGPLPSTLRFAPPPSPPLTCTSHLNLAAAPLAPASAHSSALVHSKNLLNYSASEVGDASAPPRRDELPTSTPTSSGSSILLRSFHSTSSLSRTGCWSTTVWRCCSPRRGQRTPGDLAAWHDCQDWRVSS